MFLYNSKLKESMLLWVQAYYGIYVTSLYKLCIPVTIWNVKFFWV
jgi:hypothetical protein